MTNTLTKISRKNYTAGSPGVPANPGQPAIPERWVYEDVYSCQPEAGAFRNGLPSTSGVSGDGLSITQSDSVVFGTYQGLVATYGAAAASTSIVCKTRKVGRLIPAQPAIAPTPGIAPVPAQTIIDNLLGWNARAHSKKSFPSYGKITFKAKRAIVGAVVGLNDVPADSGYSDIRFAFYLANGIARVMERGVEKYYAGAYADNATFAIYRLSGKIYYLIDGAQVYVSNNTSAPLFMDAALYSGGDTVDSPTISAWYGSDASLPALVGIGGAGTVKSGGNIELPRLTVSSGMASRANISLPSLVSIASQGAYSRSSASLPALETEAAGGLIAPGYAISENIVLFLSGTGSGKTGEIGHATVSLPKLSSLGANRTYGQASAKLPALTGYGSAYEGNRAATMFSASVGVGFFAAPVELYVTMYSTGEIASVFAAGLVVPAEVQSSATAETDYAIQSLLGALMYSSAAGNCIAPLTDDGRAVWVVNTESGASSRYENYAFNSFAKIGGRYYGAKQDGLYLLEGDTDEGDPIQAMLGFGAQTFGTSAKKSVPHCYVGLSSAGNLFLKVLYEGKDYIYSARSASSDMSVQRFDLGKGIKANYLEFELYNKDGDDFELDTVEFVVAELSRRI